MKRQRAKSRRLHTDYENDKLPAHVNEAYDKMEASLKGTGRLREEVSTFINDLYDLNEHNKICIDPTKPRFKDTATRKKDAFVGAWSEGSSCTIIRAA